MSPVFRHGRLRLYLLKLLDESPRHGYEVIRLLQDRFMGVYAPSPGTIYPRLARLEEDGLVTHEEVDGKKVYSITDKGREEIRSRLSDLADLEDELTESLRDVAKEISEDVRDTVRTIREELASAAREFRAEGGRGRARSDRRDTGDRGPESDGTPGPSASGEPGGDRGPAPDDAPSRDEPGRGERPSEEARRIREEARRSREQMRARFRAQGRSHSDWAAWAGRADWSPWGSWAEWTGFRDEPGRDEPGESAGNRPRGRARDSAPGAGERSRRGGPNPFGDLERMAMQFATELRAAAKQTGNLGERSLNDLRDILTDTLAKVRAEVFADTGPGSKAADAESRAAAQSGSEAETADGSADTGGKPETQ
jgi:DNA-binding PadR family transcriptional regulator